jgi:hypothetical protein
MAEYLVTWTIEVDADSPEAAARLAQVIQRSPQSLATFFKVEDESGGTHEVDLEDRQ